MYQHAMPLESTLGGCPACTAPGAAKPAKEDVLAAAGSRASHTSCIPYATRHQHEHTLQAPIGRGADCRTAGASCNQKPVRSALMDCSPLVTYLTLTHLDPAQRLWTLILTPCITILC